MSSVTLHPAIAGLDPGSLCYSIYNQLYHNFFNAQDKKDDEHPYGVAEGDDTSIRLRNTAYGFAEAIAGSVAGDAQSGEGGILLDYLKKTGGDMTGKLTANYEFEAGFGNNRVLEIFKKEETDTEGQVISEIFGVKITGNLEIGASSFYIGGKQLLSYSQETDTAKLASGTINFDNAILRSTGEFIFGDNKETGIYITPQTLLIKGKEVFHKGNANLETVDWSMKDGNVNGDLQVKGKTVLSGLLRACHGAELGINDTVFISIDPEKININTFLSFASGYGIKIENTPVLIRTGEKDIQLGAVGGDLVLGNENTNKIRLQAGISDIDGDYLLISKYGAAYFPDSLKVRHNYGDELLSSYRVDASDEGMIVHKKLRFGTSGGAYLYGIAEGVAFSSSVEHITPDERTVLHYDTTLKYLSSTSKYKPLNRLSDTLSISTGADFILLNKPLETKGHIGIDNSFTRITDGCLFFTSEHYLLSASEGIKHYGNAYFLSNLASEYFSSGFAGSGWAILKNGTTGNVSATFDELTVRKKMRIYELEVQKISATNGSLWISDNCQGDVVIKL
ncbi:MAG: hypothetical protein EZS26_001045 [Candidatus Ordinivivax streblomastigis]|uniref:Uncharacterized protein n=1 Tax=Candidatus Ordinivivax streblomastigis TaxID=2540710 RepID=A0A5M8P319_9BACT|nr:MAG: hypothetical protein EZS26_001045 [Candidatus Ordinivivax streblomastigis]